MLVRFFAIALCMTTFCLGQLPDRDALVKKLVEGSSSDSDFATQELIKHFQMGGLRTVVRNLNRLPDEKKIQYMHVLRHMDLFRFRNDLNANLIEAPNDVARMVALRLLATFGERLNPEIFEPYVANEENPIQLRLAAMSGLIQAQRPAAYDRFVEIAEKATFDPITGQDDFAFAEISAENRGFFLYTKSKLEDKKAPLGAVMVSIYLAGPRNDDIYTNLLDQRRRKLIPLLIDRAILAGAPNLLELMADHKTCRKKVDDIKKAMPAARAIADLKKQFFKHEIQQMPIAPRLDLRPKGSGTETGFRSAYGVVKVSDAGEISVVESFSPFGGSGDLAGKIGNKTFPAFVDWQPVESYFLVATP
ncbi:hypothetical protein [Acanthopleuribacter pedis]|uniref:Uncharacterized protein n=1 Tax=Acanthopleuribacter pedis TaxID=442870 RepID=A0A8J7QI40_9BACT|nr:hypothetical protein [Acanthopleuribacter pedis]MBO1321056.1 hypothetical protein [Acanthopleuribacter pedis]